MARNYDELSTMAERGSARLNVVSHLQNIQARLKRVAGPTAPTVRLPHAARFALKPLQLQARQAGRYVRGTPLRPIDRSRLSRSPI
jgi:hypothetical protein